MWVSIRGMHDSLLPVCSRAEKRGQAGFEITPQHSLLLNLAQVRRLGHSPMFLA